MRRVTPALVNRLMMAVSGALSWLLFVVLALLAITGSGKLIWDALRGGAGRWTWMCRVICVGYGLWWWRDWNRPSDGTIGRNATVMGIMRPILEAAQAYFSAHLILDYDKEQARRRLAGHPVMLCCHPHGIWGLGVLANLAFNNGPSVVKHSVYAATLNIHFCIPGWRELCLALGLVSVSRRSIQNLLRASKDVAVVLGGARESLDARSGVMELTIRGRRGFFRLALEHGAAICPVITFGEVELFHQVRTGWLRWAQARLLKWMSFALPVFWGQYLLVPAPIPLTTVVGDPISVTKIAKPTDEDIKALQDVYVTALTALHAKFDRRYSPCPTTLIIK